MPTVLTRTRTFVTLGLACALAATPALAAPETQSKVVRFADLDLTTQAGEQALRGRIARAAALVCGEADLRDLRATSLIDACRVSAMANAAPQMQVAIANARNGKAYAVNTVKIAPASL
jgi:UrcA family protein